MVKRASFFLTAAAAVFFSALISASCQKKPSDTETSEVLPDTEPLTTETVAVPYQEPSAASSPSSLYNLPVSDLNGVKINMSGLPNSLDQDGINSLFNIGFSISNSDADVTLVSRDDMELMASQGTIEDITEGVLSSGLPEYYYGAGWINNRLYGFSAEPYFADGLMIYNKGILEDYGAFDPGDMFDRGEWGWNDFELYCSFLKESLPETISVLDISEDIFFYNAVYSNGGYVFHPEISQPVTSSPSLIQAKNFTGNLVESAFFTTVQGSFADGSAIFTHGDEADLERYNEMGLDVGAVPYPWGDNIRLNSGSKTKDTMLLGNYRTYSSDAELLVITKNDDGTGALSKAGIKDYISIAINYLSKTDEIAKNGVRERNGQSPYLDRSGYDITFLDLKDLRRLDWWRSRPVVFMPMNPELSSELKFE